MAELMTVQELANYLRVTKKTIYRLLRRDSIPATKVGRSWRFDKASIDDWLSRQSVGVKASILVIDDEETIQLLFKETLEDLGHRVITAETSSEGLELVKQRHFDLVFLDLKMPGMGGVELFQRIKTIKPALPVTIITGYPDSDMMAQALVQGPFGVMNKPFDESDIIAAVNSFAKISTARKLE
ncbi:MAG: response regulator [Dehalococcoidia bacterium]|nr:response regulator [Dehalococcoidia bacterium]